VVEVLVGVVVMESGVEGCGWSYSCGIDGDGRGVMVVFCGSRFSRCGEGLGC